MSTYSFYSFISISTDTVYVLILEQVKTLKYFVLKPQKPRSINGFIFFSIKNKLSLFLEENVSLKTGKLFVYCRLDGNIFLDRLSLMTAIHN